MQMVDVSALLRFISLLNCVLLTDKPYCKFMLKYETQNYLRKFAKTLSEIYKCWWNKRRADLVM